MPKKIKIPTKDEQRVQDLENTVSELMMELAFLKAGV